MQEWPRMSKFRRGCRLDRIAPDSNRPKVSLLSAKKPDDEPITATHSHSLRHRPAAGSARRAARR